MQHFMCLKHTGGAGDQHSQITRAHMLSACRSISEPILPYWQKYSGRVAIAVVLLNSQLRKLPKVKPWLPLPHSHFRRGYTRRNVHRLIPSALSMYISSHSCRKGRPKVAAGTTFPSQSRTVLWNQMPLHALVITSCHRQTCRGP